METVDAVHDFWFTQPARDSHELLAKFARWYQGGDDLDRSIRLRFSGLIERALSGQLSEWQSEPRGKLALILLLDQFTRNAFRGLPRAYAGDAAALELALSLVDSPAYNALPLESRLFCTMPLVHSETLALQERAVALAHAMGDDAPPELRGPWQFGAQRTLHYCAIIRRFGRFPHRNEILGRESTAEELAFLADQAQSTSPLTAATATAAL
jgi:uncharacterized protein (DUF924 family)